MTPEYYQRNKERLKAQMKAYQEKNKEKLKEYYKAYYRANKPKWQTPEARAAARERAHNAAAAKPESERKEARRKNYLANREHQISRAKSWQRDHQEHKREYDKAYHDANREKKLAQMRARYERNREKWQAYYQARKDLFRERSAAWRAANPDKCAAARNRRRARLANGESPGVTPAEWREILAQYNNLCAYCGRDNKGKRLERDHVVPVSKGGLDSPDNVVPACRTCNARKAARLDWKP